MVGVGVLAYVHGGQLEAERGERADGAVHPAVGEQCAAVLAQGRLDEREVLEELAGAEVVAAVHVRGAPGEALLGVLQLLPDAGGLEPVGLLGVEALVAGADLREALQVVLEGGEEFLGGAGVADRVRQEAAQLVDELQGVVDAVLVLEDQDVPGDGGGDVRVAVAVAADPGAEGEGAGGGGQGDADALQLGGEVLEDVTDGAGVQLVEVVDRVACLVGGLGPHDAQFVGLPHQVDVLGEAGVVAAAVGLDDGGLEECGDAAQLVEDGAPGGLGRVGGEHRPYVQVPDRFAQVVGVGVLEAVGGAGEEAALGGAAGAQLAASVDLLGHVRQMEVRREGADQLGRGLQFRVAEQAGGGFAVLPGEAADLLDQFEELGALLTYECLAEEVAESADVGAQLGAGGGLTALVVGTAHRCGSLQC